MESSDVCLICKKTLDILETVEVKEKGIQTLINASNTRKDNIFASFQGASVTLHKQCRKNYIHPKCVAAWLKRPLVSLPPPAIGEGYFDYDSSCIFCTTDASEEFIQSQKKLSIQLQRVTVSVITKEETKNNIIKICSQHNDDTWSAEVLSRILHVDVNSVRVKYHQHCYSKFFQSKASSGQKRGRPVSSEMSDVMEHVYEYVGNHLDDSQFSIGEIRSALNIDLPDDRTIKTKLLERYGEDIIISNDPGKSSVLCFLNIGHKIIHEHWYTEKRCNDEDERLRIVRTAADIILQDIRSKIYNTTTYPAPENFMDNLETDIPDSLNLLLSILLKNSKSGSNTNITKIISVAHSIISAVRPRSFRSPLLLGISSFLHQKYASKLLIDVLYALGFCVSYDEVQKFEVSAIAHPQPEPQPDFTQFIYDNADFNVRTLDGLNTFHVMGGIGIVCHTPKATKNNEEIVRIKNIPPAAVVGHYGHVPVQHFIKTTPGLKQHLIKSIQTDEYTPMSNLDFMWLFGKSEGFPKIKGWNDFMRDKNKSKDFEISEVAPLPFINSPASDYDTIYTALLNAVDKAASLKIDICVVTFDQPLYQKAQEIVLSSSDSRINKIVLRLGGFHLLMSFLGSIGYIMAGSGIKELWSQIYAPVSIEKMLNGHAYSRTIRAHMLSQLALFKIIVKFIDLTIDERADLDEILHDLEDGQYTDDAYLNRVCQAAITKFENALLVIENHGPTAKLWITYFKMIILVKNFIAAERSGDWDLHLSTIRSMLPYFHAAGHYCYAKSSTLYLQQMEDLQQTMPHALYEKWLKKGYFTIRRKDNFWSGTWSDMTIEQTLMRSMKSIGGLTHGRGVTDSVISKWILAMPVLQTISEAIEEFCNVSSNSTDQHVDARESRVKRDKLDVDKLDHWLEEHNPFPVLEHIMCLSTGLIGGDDINCQDAFSVGKQNMASKVGQNFADVSYSRKARVLSLSTVNSSIVVDGSKIPVEPETLFRRICISQKSNEELKEYFEYELAPYPIALFDQGFMRKSKKSMLYELFAPIDIQTIPSGSRAYIIDGGFLLHKALWQKNQKFSDVCNRYINFVRNHYGANATVIFDGYGNTNTTTKNMERLKRSKGRAYAEIKFSEHMPVTVSQETFLSNENNKKRLISLLLQKMNNNGILAKQCADDADADIVRTAIDKAETHQCAIIVGEDVDLLVILTGTCTKTNVFMEKPGRGKIETKIYSPQSLIDPVIRSNILFVHAASGCDTTSALFRQGKKKVVTVLKKTIQLNETLQVFKSPDASYNDIKKVGENLLCNLYGYPDATDINNVRFKMFSQSLTKSKFNLCCLPPTAEAAKQHFYRVYHQIQKWNNSEKPPTEWGWKMTDQGLLPIQTLKDAAPKKILDIISCKCKKMCAKNCTCKRAGMKCTSICMACDGQPCQRDTEYDEDDGWNDNVSDSNCEIPKDYTNKKSEFNNDENEDPCTRKKQRHD